MQTIILTKSTSTDYKRKQIENNTFLLIKINFKLSNPTIGKIVMLNDGEELLTKDMFRFIKEADLVNFAITNPYRFTKILTISDIESITVLENEEIES